MVIGGGYGMEIAILYYILTLLDIKIDKIIGIDMPNVVNLQNYFFKQTKLDTICQSYTSSFLIDNIDCIYSNCCLAEVPPDINFEYYNNYFLKSQNVYIVWTTMFSNVPEYYEPYLDKEILEKYNLDKNVNKLIVK